MKTGIILPLVAMMATAGCTRQIPVAAPTWHSDVRHERSATTDTVTTIVEVEKPPSDSQSTLTTIGRYATGILIGILLILFAIKKL
ncbi:MAG: hypothetical protein NC421_00455 [Lachnospiraceae bacterium]|nr:hypothetical protein [Lachnospiraceae bacterium]